jgi:uncharacterized membrane protein
MFLAVLLLVGLGLAGVAVWRGGISELFGGTTQTSGSRAERTTGTEADTPTTEAEAKTETGTQSKSEHQQQVEPELTDRELVLGILDDNDGQMKQARIVDETDWSKSKVSMVLSEMEEGGDISKLRVGRENIISLEGSEPEAAGSPFDDE